MLSWIYNELWSECSIFCCCRETSSKVNDTLSKAYRCVPTSSEFGCVSRWNLLTRGAVLYNLSLFPHPESLWQQKKKRKQSNDDFWRRRGAGIAALKKKRINQQDRLRCENMFVFDWEEMKVFRGKMRQRKEESTRHTNLSKVRTLHSCTCALTSEHVCVLN